MTTDAHSSCDERDERALPLDWIVPSWPVASRVRGFVTTRNGGVSSGPWGGAASGSSGGGLNLGRHAGDDAASVDANRGALARRLPAEPAWLDQVHGTRVVDAAEVGRSGPKADGSFTSRPRTVCAILVADCMPILFAHRDGTRVGAAHAGWRGLVAGVVEATIACGGFVPDETVAWIGPSIGPSRFEVGDDVRNAFVAMAGDDQRAVVDAFVPHFDGKWLADLPALARTRLAACGVTDVHESGLCTMSDADRFYSYRRDGITGRMAALIWIDA